MIIIKDILKILNKNEKKLLQKKCDNFIIHNMPDEKSDNNYVRYMLDKNDIEINSILKKINKIIKEHTQVSNLEIGGVWINKVDETTNKKDTYHKDKSDMTIIIYLNEDFEGGEFEYIENEDNHQKTFFKIKPKKYLSILSDNELKHRVLPVLSGTRYSFVVFYNFISKTKKSLI